MNAKDKQIIRELAKRVAEIAELPIMAERRRLWKKHNSLQSERPMVYVSAEGSWRELLPQDTLECSDEEARRIEYNLRTRIYMYEHFNDDRVIEKVWVVYKAINHTSWGLEPKFRPSSTTGAWGFDPVLINYDDLEKLVPPKVEHDEEETRRREALAHELFDGILNVVTYGVNNIEFHLMNQYCKLRGLDQVMLDMYDHPDMVHATMRILQEGHQSIIDQYAALNLLSPNNEDYYHLAGDVGFSCSGPTYTNDLPQADFNPERVRTIDMWGSAEAQDMTHISPAMFKEFVFPYELKLLEQFGLTGYGCCEDLTRKLETVMTIPNLRRISVSPWADVPKCAEQIQGRFILSWKPHPGTIVGDFDPDYIRQYIRDAIIASRGCTMDIVLKDTHTCDNHPERFTIWTTIAKELATSGLWR
ncbi:MAG TPA: hypothetical protein GX008_11965 [Firmicutes bacterium]|jgi:hypothetical protein|nr:MAG: hypothetical protein AA931_06375 [Peptococcaceae bacterium 1109]HHT74415.1 hypothetical protein [Bacillota bacterium]